MTLKERIDQYKKESAGKATPEMVAVMQRCTAELQATVAVREIPKVGDSMPGFKLPDSNGTSVDSDQMKTGPLVVTFFRGVW